MNWNKLRLFTAVLVTTLFAVSAKAQMEIQKGIEGKTFFDTARKEVHEAYEYKLRYTMMINPRTGDAEPVGSPEELRNGLYIRYRKDGTIECTGYYKNDVPCGKWKHMDATGKLVAREEVIAGDCVVTE